MQYAERIVEHINDYFKSIFERVKIYGIAKPVVDTRNESDKGGITLPAMLNDNGECDNIEFDEEAIVVYHRVIALQATPSNKAGFGRSLNPLQVKMKMCIVIFSDYTKTKISPEALAIKIHSSISRESYRSLLPGVKNTSILINDTILNETQVFGEEFKNVDPFLAPEHSLIKINYTVESTVNQKCFNTMCKQTS